MDMTLSTALCIGTIWQSDSHVHNSKQESLVQYIIISMLFEAQLSTYITISLLVGVGFEVRSESMKYSKVNLIHTSVYC